jgi:acyl-coenzyme A synthetase/AMP-(fatty) acid ligase
MANAVSVDLDTLETRIGAVIGKAGAKFEHFPRDIILLERLPRAENGKIRMAELERYWREQLSLETDGTADVVFRGRSTNLRIYQVAQ